MSEASEGRGGGRLCPVAARRRLRGEAKKRGGHTCTSGFGCDKGRRLGKGERGSTLFAHLPSGSGLEEGQVCGDAGTACTLLQADPARRMWRRAAKPWTRSHAAATGWAPRHPLLPPQAPASAPRPAQRPAVAVAVAWRALKAARRRRRRRRWAASIPTAAARGSARRAREPTLRARRGRRRACLCSRGAVRW